MSGLTLQEIMTIVNQYIGVSGGYLGGFGNRTHTDFYLEYCNLEIDPNNYEGTIREKFIAILKNSSREVQAKIVRGVLRRFPVNAENKPTTRTIELYDALLASAKRLESASPVAIPDLKITSESVERAISDVKTLIQTGDPISAVDRIHTVLHGYLRAVCDKENITYNNDDSMTRLLKILRQQHPALQNLGPRSHDIERILNSLSTIMDSLNPIRNSASIAHPNAELLGKDESMLVINAGLTLLDYLNSKFR